MAVQNVLLRVTVPKRTGRKRKRGSNDPFEYHAEGREVLDEDAEDAPIAPPLTAEQLRRRLIDNADAYTVQPVATIKQTHRFRALPDFQLQAGSQPVMDQIGKSLVNPTCESPVISDLLRKKSDKNSVEYQELPSRHDSWPTSKRRAYCASKLYLIRAISELPLQAEPWCYSSDRRARSCEDCQHTSSEEATSRLGASRH